MDRIESSLADALEIDQDSIPKAARTRLEGLFSQTSLQERLSLYAIARYGYTGQGDIFDVGCAAGGSTACLAAGLNEGPIKPKRARVHAFDLFDGYSIKAFASEISAQELDLHSDLELFTHQIGKDRDVVQAHQLDLSRPFKGDASANSLEIVHIDAAKSLELWTSIILEIGASIIPGKTIWIFQDFERVRLPWHVWSLHALLDYGEIIGGARLGTLYFRFERMPPPRLIDRIAQHDFSIEDALQAVEGAYDVIGHRWARHFETDGLSLNDFRIGGLAYSHFWLGDREEARQLFLGTSERFRNHHGSRVYLRELSITG